MALKDYVLRLYSLYFTSFTMIYSYSSISQRIASIHFVSINFTSFISMCRDKNEILYHL